MMQETDKQLQQNIRFYRNQYPQNKDLVIGQVVNSQENGCYVELPEYQNKRGMIPLNEYSKSMRKAVHRVMKAGKQQVLRVIRVDKQKCYIDLSKKDVNQIDQQIGQEKFSNSKTVNAIIRHVSEKTKIPLRDLYEEFVWGLYEKFPNHHPLEILKQLLIHPQKIEQFGIKNEEVKIVLIAQLQRRFKQALLKTISVIQVSVKSFDGIRKIKQILNRGMEATRQKNIQSKIFIIGAPSYMIQVTTATKQQGKAAIDIAIEAIKEGVKQENGVFQIKKQAKVTGDTHALISELYNEDQQKEAASGSDQQDQQN